MKNRLAIIFFTLFCTWNVNADESKQSVQSHNHEKAYSEQHQLLEKMEKFSLELPKLPNLPPLPTLKKYDYCVRTSTNNNDLVKCNDCWSYLSGDAGKTDCTARLMGHWAYFGSCSEPDNANSCK